MGAAREDDLAVVSRAAFERDGALQAPQQLTSDEIDGLRRLADARIGGRPGARLAGEPALTAVLGPEGAVGRLAAALTSAAARPVRVVLFDKTAESNWSVTWHQDRTIPVRERLEVDGFGPWSTKDGMLHVAPPFQVLARMATLRVHLDPVDENNAPLRVALGSHRLGQVAAGEAMDMVGQHPVVVCTAAAGDIWAYRTPVLHASHAAARPGRRRVLQIDYADFDLPGGLRWSDPGQA